MNRTTHLTSEALIHSPFFDTELFALQTLETAEDIESQLPATPPSSSPSFPSGKTLLVVTGPALTGEEYFDPFHSGNPLLDVKGAHARVKLSPHFTAGEFARSGSIIFAKARIDPALVTCIEALRAFLKTPLTIIDGYYSFKHLLELAKRLKLDKPPISPHLSGRAAKFKAGALSGLDLAKAVVFACPRDTTILIGESSAAIYVKQVAPEVTSYISNGEKREQAVETIRKYRQLFFSDAAMLAATRDDLTGAQQFVHSAVHRHQIRDETMLVDVAFYASDYVKKKRQKHGLSGRFDRNKPVDRDLRKEILEKAVRPLLGELVAPAAHSGGVATTPKKERDLAPEKPDKPPLDLTGRYETIHRDQSEELGKTMCINQAGTHIEVVVSPVDSPLAPYNKKRFANRYYGDFKKGGTVRLFARNVALDELQLIPSGNTVHFTWKSSGSSGREVYQRVSDRPVLFEQAIASFPKEDRPLLEAYEWKPLLQRQIKFLRQFFGDHDRMGRLMSGFYDAKEDLQHFQEWYQAQAVKKFGATARKWVKDPTRGYHLSDYALALYYTRQILAFNRWRPSSSYPYLSIAEWAQRAVSVVEYQSKHHSNRTGNRDPSVFIDDLVEFMGLKKAAQSDGHLHKYRFTMKLYGGSAILGGFGGTLTVEKIDDRKWPQGSESFKIWFVTVGAGVKLKKGKGARAIGPFKLGETHVGLATSHFFWLPNDFPSQVRLAFGELSASAGAKVGGEAGFMHILGRAGLPLMEVFFGDADIGAGRGMTVGAGAEIIAGIGAIRDKSFKDVFFPPMPEKSDYAIAYGLNKSAHFGFNSAFLTEEARQALRVMATHELVALMSPDSKLSIDAYTDAVGTPDKNLTLSALRAANTGQALEDIMGKKLRCTVNARGHGEKEAAGETLRNQDRRRVDLRLNGRLVLRLRG